MAALCRKLQVSADYLLGLEREGGIEIAEPTSDYGSEEIGLVPLVSDEIAAGPPALIEDRHAVLNLYAFRLPWLERVAKRWGEPGRLIVIRVAKGYRGESMLPTLKPGSLALVDRGPGARGASEIDNDRIYLVRDPSDGGISIKRLFRDRDYILVYGDNPEAPRRVVRLSRELPIQRLAIGRVRWYANEEA